MARRLTRIALWLGAIAILLGLLELLGVPVFDWIGDLFDRVGEVPARTGGTTNCAATPPVAQPMSKTMAMIAVNQGSGYFLGPFGVGLKAIEMVNKDSGAAPRAAAIASARSRS